MRSTNKDAKGGSREGASRQTEGEDTGWGSGLEGDAWGARHSLLIGQRI